MIISWVDCQKTPAKQREFEQRALAAREWFKQHGPPDAPVFPIGYAERESLKMGGLPHLVACFARSLAGQKYKLEEHLSFDEYASGVMASEEHAPSFIANDEDLRRRFPPRPLKGLGPGLWWDPPKPRGARPEVRRRRSKQVELLYAAARAEDEAVACVHELDPAVALATACSVEQTLAIIWEAEQEEMRRRRDPRKVMCISRTRVRELDVALASLPHGVHPDPAAERYLLQIMKDLPPDRAWWVAHLVVRYAQFRMSQLSADRKSDQNTDMDDSRHAAARL